MLSRMKSCLSNTHSPSTSVLYASRLTRSLAPVGYKLTHVRIKKKPPKIILFESQDSLFGLCTHAPSPISAVPPRPNSRLYCASTPHLCCALTPHLQLVLCLHAPSFICAALLCSISHL